MTAALGPALSGALARLAEVWREVGLTGIVDILLMALIVYAGLVWMRRSQASKVVQGVLLTGLFYLTARQFNLFLTSAVLEAFFAVALVALIVIFRDELRRLFERVSRWRPTSRLRRQKGNPPVTALVETLTRTLTDLARERIGALIVIRRKDALDLYLDGGVQLNGEPSEALLKSLFDVHSIGHDGAVVIERGVVTRFACHLPLSTSFDTLGSKGTRHAAALGLAERSDALCLVVSEERGVISAAEEDELRQLDDPEALAALLTAYLEEAPRPRRAQARLRRRDYRAIAAAVGISMLLWLVLVHGAKQSLRDLTVPVVLTDVPPEMTAAVTPQEVTLTLAGQRRNFYFFGRGSAQITLSLTASKAKSATRTIHASEVTVPKDLKLREIKPSSVRVSLSPRTPAAKAPQAPR